MVVIFAIAEVAAAGFTLGVFLRNIPFRANIHAAAGALCMLRGIIAFLAGEVFAAGGSGMILAIAGKVAERLAGGSAVILTIAVEMALLPTGSGTMVACFTHMTVSYTHLDVYKRQGQHLLILVSQIC